MRRHWKAWSITGAVLILAVACVAIFHVALSPVNSAQSHLTAVAKRYAGVDKVDHFYRYSRDKTYYSIAGINNKNEAVYVIMPAKGSSVQIVKQSSGITAQQAVQKVKDSKQPKKIISTNLGMNNGKLVWEVTFLNAKDQLGYETFSFKTGKVVSIIENL